MSMSHPGRVVVGVLALALVAAAAVVGWRLLSTDSDADGAEPGFVVDELGCVDGIYANTDFALDGDDGGDLIVCHYDKLPADLSSGQSHELASSSELVAEESAAVRDAVAAASRGRPEFTACPPDDDSPGEFFLVRTADQVAFWVYNADCGDNGVLVVGPNGGVAYRHDTAAVLEALGSLYGPLGPDTGGE